MEQEENIFVIKAEELKDVVPELSDEPTVEEIKTALSRMPAYIEHMERLVAAQGKKLNEMKTLIKANKQYLEREKSRIRQEKLNSYKKELDDYFEKIHNLFDDVLEKDTDRKITKGTISEIARALRPEKPTKSDLDDIANIETTKIQKKIVDQEQKLNDMEEEFEFLKVKAEKYENTLKAAVSHKGIIVAEYGAGMQKNQS